jgi:predicted O-linked N-acetylglucosamine transferase (SPINDLY family)
MGVPMVTLAGNVHRARVGASLLGTLQLPDLVATDEAAYIATAVRLAADPARLLDLHKALRAKFLRSPLCNAARYAKELEAALRTTWSTWCAS